MRALPSGARAFACAVLAFIIGCTPVPQRESDPEETDPTAVVTALLTESAAAWNAGDLERFVSDYARDSTTTFVSGGRVRSGFTWIRGNYAPAFERGAARDSLQFQSVAARWLGPEHVLATARFVLFRGDSVTASGPFTLVLREVEGDWKIMHDHTSRDPD